MQKNISQQTRQQAEIQYAEIVGRLYACELLENETENIEDSKVLYGWAFLTQEVLIRLAEATLKLIYQIHFDKKPPRGHSLQSLWRQIPDEVRQDIEKKRGQKLSFEEYDNNTFQDVRYSAERLRGGRTTSFRRRQLYLDSLTATAVAEDWLGEITTWPWAGVVDDELRGYQIIPLTNNTYEVWIKEPIEPLDWAGAKIIPKENYYVWTLYFGFTDQTGQRRGFELPSFIASSLPLDDLAAKSVIDCVQQIYKVYEEPEYPLLQALEEARRVKATT